MQPFGCGVVSVLVPQQLVRVENSLLLWAADQPSKPVHSFLGHTDVVYNFDWRPNTLQVCVGDTLLRSVVLG